MATRADAFHSEIPRGGGYSGPGVRAEYSKGTGATPRIRGSPRNHTHRSNSVLVAEKLWKGARARRMFVRSARVIPFDTPIETTPTTAAEKRTPIAQSAMAGVRSTICAA